MTIHKDNLGQPITPGDVVISVRSSTNYVPRMLVLAPTAQRIKTNNGHFDPTTLVVVTKTIQEFEMATYDRLIADHGADVVLQPVIQAPKLTTRFVFVELYQGGAFGYRAASHIGIVEIKFTTSDSYVSARREIIDKFRDDGYGVGNLELNKIEPGYPGRRPNQRYQWGFGRSPAVTRFTAKALQELGVDGLSTNEAIPVAEFNAAAIKEINYIHENMP